jgi:hypothetical protein
LAKITVELVKISNNILPRFLDFLINSLIKLLSSETGDQIRDFGIFNPKIYTTELIEQGVGCRV